MKKLVTSVAVLALLSLAVPSVAATPRAKLKVHSSSLGRYLVDGSNRALYLFAKDHRNKSNCSGGCAKNWAPLLTSGKASAGGGVSAAKIGTIRRAGGAHQVTYNGHPLYRFIGDTRAGQANGEGVTAFGAKWYVVTPAGTANTGSYGSGY